MAEHIAREAHTLAMCWAVQRSVVSDLNSACWQYLHHSLSKGLVHVRAILYQMDEACLSRGFAYFDGPLRAINGGRIS